MATESQALSLTTALNDTLPKAAALGSPLALGAFPGRGRRLRRLRPARVVGEGPPPVARDDRVDAALSRLGGAAAAPLLDGMAGGALPQPARSIEGEEGAGPAAAARGVHRGPHGGAAPEVMQQAHPGVHRPRHANVQACEGQGARVQGAGCRVQAVGAVPCAAGSRVQPGAGGRRVQVRGRFGGPGGLTVLVERARLRHEAGHGGVGPLRRELGHVEEARPGVGREPARDLVRVRVRVKV